MSDHPPTFAGFPRSAIEFLAELADNNEKAWFEAHREDFQRSLQQPFQQLVAALTPSMLGIDPEFEVTPRTDRTISRIRRDTRFAKGKAPYRTNMWITFKHLAEDWKDRPAYYFELRPTGYSSGMGFFDAGRPTMDAFRRLISQSPDEFRKAIAFTGTAPSFQAGGGKYKRPIPGAPEGLEDWYQRKNLYLYRESPIDDRVFSPALVDDLVLVFETLAPLYHYLWIAGERGRG